MAALRSGMGVGPTTSRSRRHAITPDALADAWPELARVLRGELRQGGLDRDLADEVLQEVAVRALADRAPRELSALIAWAKPVSVALAADLLARPTTLDIADLIDRPGVHDVPHEASRRLALDAVLHELAAMPEAERDAVLAGLDYGAQTTLAEARHAAVRRFRARQVLARIAQSFGLVAFWRLSRRTLHRLAVPTASVATAAVVVALMPSQQQITTTKPLPVVLPRSRPVVVLRPDARFPLLRSSAVPAQARTAQTRPRVARPAAPDAPASPKRTVIEGPAGTRIEHREKPQQPDDPIACVYSTLTREVCTPRVALEGTSEAGS